MAWHFDSKGEFSVKSAYHVLKDKNDLSQRRQVGEDSAISDHTCNFNWKKIWAKVKLFFWRLSHNNLPLRMNIFCRGMDIDTRCPVCWRLNEDGGHCFLKCKFVKKCWRALNLEQLRLVLIDLNSAKQVAIKILSLEEDKKLLVIDFVWVWWDAWNKANVGEKLCPLRR